MRNKELIKQRFAELEQKMRAVSEKREFIYEDKKGHQHYKIDPPSVKEWGTGVLNLLQRVFGETSVHYRLFSSYYSLLQSTTFSLIIARLYLRLRKKTMMGVIFSMFEG